VQWIVDLIKKPVVDAGTKKRNIVSHHNMNGVLGGIAVVLVSAIGIVKTAAGGNFEIIIIEHGNVLLMKLFLGPFHGSMVIE